MLSIDVELTKKDIELLIGVLYHASRGEKDIEELVTHLENQLRRF